MADPQRDFDERAAEVRGALAALRSEVDELQVHLQGAAVPRLPTDAAESQAGVDDYVREAPAPGSPSAQPRDTGRDQEAAAAGAVATGVEGFDPDEVLPERLVTKSDAELGKTFDIAASLGQDADERRDVEAVAYWRTLAAAVLEEARRRPEFGKASGASRISPRRIVERRHRRSIARLARARERYAAREE